MQYILSQGGGLVVGFILDTVHVNILIKIYSIYSTLNCILLEIPWEVRQLSQGHG